MNKPALDDGINDNSKIIDRIKLESDYYWSSTENDGSYAWSFFCGKIYQQPNCLHLKATPTRVRPIAAF